jgi:hypothetical protein
MLTEFVFNEIVWVFVLAFYAIFILLFFTRKTYDLMISRGVKKSSAVYFNRKLVHIFAGGVIVLIVPHVFSSPWYPLLSGLVLAVFMYSLHRTGRILFWFQTREDVNDVNFCFMWALAVFILWWVTGSPWIAIIPPAFMAFGDGITGIIRNLAFKERVKHPIGNLYIACVCIPIGYYFGSIEGIALWGVIAAVVASIVEKFEIGPVDDNVLITVTSLAVLIFGKWFGPITF